MYNTGQTSVKRKIGARNGNDSGAYQAIMDYSSTQSFFDLRRHRSSFPLNLPGFQSSEAGYLPSLPAQDSLETFGSEEEESAAVFSPSNSLSGQRRTSSGDQAFFDNNLDPNLDDNVEAGCDKNGRVDDSWFNRGKTEVWDDRERSEADCYGKSSNGFYLTSCASEEGLRQKVRDNYWNYTMTSGCDSKQVDFHCKNGAGAFNESSVEYNRMDSGREEDYGSSCGSSEEQIQAALEGSWQSVSPSNHGEESRWREVLEDHQSLTTANASNTYTQKLDSFSEAFLSRRKRRFPLTEQIWEGETTDPAKSRQSCVFGSDPHLPPSSFSPAVPGLISFPSPPTPSHLMSSVLSPPPTPLPPPSHSPSKMDSPGSSVRHAAPLQGEESLGALQFFMSHLQSVPSAHSSRMVWKFPPMSHCFSPPGGKTNNAEENPRSSDCDGFCSSTAAADVPQSPQSVFFTSSSHRPSSLHPTRALCYSSVPSRHASFHLPPPISGQHRQAEDSTAIQTVQDCPNQSLPQKPASPIFTGKPFPSVLHSNRRQRRGRYTPQPVLDPNRKGTGLFSSLSSLHLRDEATAAYGEEEEECSVSPCINIGPDHQAVLPSCSEESKYSKMWLQGQEPLRERLLWKPCEELEESENLQDQVEKLLSLCSSSCLPGGGSNTELALHCLHYCQGNTMATLDMLLFSQPSPTGDYHFSGSDFWTDSEKSLFSTALTKTGKNFSLIQKMVKTKSVQQCVEFYYLIKKLQDKQKKQKEQERIDEELEQQRSATPKCQPVGMQFVQEEVVPVPPLASFFPCKLCGKMFYKIKSRNAHMKIHRQPQEDWSDRRLQHQLLTQRLALSRPTHLMPIPSADLLPPQPAALTFPSGFRKTSNSNPDGVNNSVTDRNLILSCNTNVLNPNTAGSYSSITFPNSHLITNNNVVDTSQRASVSISPFNPSWSSFGHQTDLATNYSNPEVKEEVLAETPVDEEPLGWQ